MGMNANLESATEGELALTDWIRIAGLLIFVAFICFSIALFGKNSNDPSAHETQPVMQASTPAAGLESRPESTPDAGVQSVAAVVEAETRAESAPSSGETPGPPLQRPPARTTTEEPKTVDATEASAIRKHRTNSVMRRPASHRRSAVDKIVLRSMNTLVGMWRRAFQANK